MGQRATYKPLKVTFFGHFGSANSGNESTLLSILSRLRFLSSGNEFCCVCTNPEVARARYGIEAIPISTKSARMWDRDISLPRRVPMAFVGLGAELAQYARAFRALKGTDALVVPGTGLVTDAYCLSHWGPYSMFKWVLMAKLRRCRVLIISVGAGPIRSNVGRVLIKAILFLADYRSYRDDASRDYLEGIGFDARHDLVYPDLVFSLPESMLPPDHARSEATRRVVGLGLMAGPGLYDSPERSRDLYARYLESLADFAKWLLAHDYDIRFLLGDDDAIVIEEFSSVLRRRLGRYDDKRTVWQPITSVQDILTELAETDVVVATRFHNTLLALLLNKPVISISFHHKCSSLMRQMSLSEYIHDIEQLDTDRLIGQFRELEENQEAVRRTIRRGVDEARAALDDQYDRLFARPRLRSRHIPRRQHPERRAESRFPA